MEGAHQEPDAWLSPPRAPSPLTWPIVLPCPASSRWGGQRQIQKGMLGPHCTLASISFSYSGVRTTPKLHTVDTTGSPTSKGSSITVPWPTTCRIGGSCRRSLGGSLFFLGAFVSCGGVRRVRQCQARDRPGSHPLHRGPCHRPAGPYLRDLHFPFLSFLLLRLVTLSFSFLGM